MSKNCLVFLTNKINRDIFRYVLYLQKEIGSFMDVWLVHDSSVQKVNNLGLQDIKFFQYPFHTIPNFFHQGSSLLPNPLLGLQKFAETYHYDHYLLMENDIVFNGVFSEFAARINAEDVDYIHIATDILGGLEKHWPVELIRNNPFAALYFSWCQIFYVSSRFLNALAKFMIHSIMSFFCHLWLTAKELEYVSLRTLVTDFVCHGGQRKNLSMPIKMIDNPIRFIILSKI